MIQVHVFRVPLGQSGQADAFQRLQDAYSTMAGKHPALLGGQLTQVGDDIEIQLRVAGHDRWRVQHNARLYATVLARRAGLPYKQAVWLHAESEPNARHLTKEAGRQFSHAPRGPAVA